jgi:hypothetical protein
MTSEPSTKLRARARVMIAVGAVALGCASQADLGHLYSHGIKAARKDDWAVAMKDLDQFTMTACGPVTPDLRCREAYLALGRGYERQGAPARAWAAFDRALTLPPHARDAAVTDDLARAQQEVLDKLPAAGERGPIVVRYRDEVPDEYSLRSVTISIDFSPVVTRDKNAGELHSPDFAQVFAGPLGAGQHVLVVESVHDCKARQDVPCTRSQLHRAWPFESVAHTPTTLELRAYADPGEANAPARPTAALTLR